jgi:pimeloyl-ACP methyl ester carboxylesterase
MGAARLALAALVAVSAVACASAPRYERLPAATALRPCDAPPCPPGPPTEGPGASAPRGEVIVRRHSEGPLGARSFTTFEPADAGPGPVPVVLFLHGFFDVEPSGADPMLRHVAASGFDVIYPSYGVPWNPAEWEEMALGAFDAAMTSLEARTADARARPDRSRVTLVGHSIGGVLALRLASDAGKRIDRRLPPPLAVVVLDGAGLATPAYPPLSIDDLSSVAASTRLLVVMSEDSYALRMRDATACRADASRPSACNAFGIARRAIAGTPQIPADHKMAVMIPSDANGATKLLSDHNAVMRTPPDAIATWGYWKLVVGALSAATKGKWGDYALELTPRMRDMGRWSDGRAVKTIVPIVECLEGGACP